MKFKNPFKVGHTYALILRGVELPRIYLHKYFHERQAGYFFASLIQPIPERDEPVSCITLRKDRLISDGYSISLLEEEAYALSECVLDNNSRKRYDRAIKED